jgi:hypothetical protein
MLSLISNLLIPDCFALVYRAASQVCQVDQGQEGLGMPSPIQATPQFDLCFDTVLHKLCLDCLFRHPIHTYNNNYVMVLPLHSQPYPAHAASYLNTTLATQLFVQHCAALLGRGPLAR